MLKEVLRGTSTIDAVELNKTNIIQLVVGVI
jgi:hypothetical protein